MPLTDTWCSTAARLAYCYTPVQVIGRLYLPVWSPCCPTNLCKGNRKLMVHFNAWIFPFVIAWTIQSPWWRLLQQKRFGKNFEEKSTFNVYDNFHVVKLNRWNIQNSQIMWLAFRYCDFIGYFNVLPLAVIQRTKNGDQPWQGTVVQFVRNEWHKEAQWKNPTKSKILVQQCVASPQLTPQWITASELWSKVQAQSQMELAGW